MERSHLYISREGEVLPEGMTFKPIVCQDAPQVWMVCEEHTKHVPHLNAQTESIPLNRTELNTSCWPHSLKLTSLSYQLAAVWTETAESTGVNSSV